MIKEELLDLLYRLSFQYNEEPIFTLASGKKSKYYIASQKTLNTGRGMELVGQLVYRLIEPLGVDAVGGPVTGADPIAYSTANEARIKGKKINVFRIRKAPKEHGIREQIVGPVEKGNRVVVVDDVITTGESTLEAIKVASEAGLSICKVIVLVDRQEGGKEAIEAEGTPVEAIFTIDDFLRLYYAHSTKDKGTLKERVISR